MPIPCIAPFVPACFFALLKGGVSIGRIGALVFGMDYPLCEGQDAGATCWRELSNKPGCIVLDGYYSPDRPVTWSGACEGGSAEGWGTLSWTGDPAEGDGTFEGKGLMVDSQRTGYWVIRFPNGKVMEGTFLDGEWNGKLSIRLPDGHVVEGAVVAGKFIGHLVEQYPDGRIREGPMANNEMHGKWVWRHPDGNVEEECWNAGAPVDC